MVKKISIYFLLFTTFLGAAQAGPSKHTPESLGLSITNFPPPLWRIIINLLKPPISHFEIFNVTAYTSSKIVDIYFEDDTYIQGNKLVIASVNMPAVTYHLKNDIWKLWRESHYAPQEIVQRRQDIDRTPWLPTFPGHALCATSSDGCLQAWISNPWGGHKTVQVFEKKAADIKFHACLKEVIDQLESGKENTEKKGK